MKPTSLQLTLRKMHEAFTSPKVLGGLLIVGLVLGVSGPFQTYEVFNLPARLAYWLTATTLTFAVGFFAGTIVEEALKARLAEWPRFALSSLATAISVVLMVMLLNTFSFGTAIATPATLLTIGAYVAVISFAVSAAFKLFIPKGMVPQDARILQRLPIEKRGALLSLSVQDHYTEVRTSKGNHLVLIRLSDAIAEAGEGLQIHRSHWVSSKAITKVERQSGKVMLTVADGTELPVSRSFLPAVKAAGLLP